MMHENKIRVLQIGCENFGKGGRSVAIFNLMKMMPDTVIVDYLSSNDSDDELYKKAIEDAGGQIVNLGKRYKDQNRVSYELKRFRALIRIIRNGKYDIVHINADHGWEAAKSMYCVRRAGNAKIVVHGHTSNVVFDKGDILKKMWLILCRMYVNKFAHAKLACSTVAAECMYGKFRKDITIIRNGIDISKYRYNVEVRNIVRKEAMLEESQLLIGFVGRLTEVKNIFFAIDVFNYLHKNIPESVMWIVGDGELQKGLENYACEKDLQNSIVFMGARSDVERLLQAMDVLLLPSYWEGLSLISVESQTAGLKVFASTGIPKEAAITDHLHRLDLSLGCECWANEIRKNIPYSRDINAYKKVQSAGYDSKLAAQELLKIYVKKQKR